MFFVIIGVVALAAILLVYAFRPGRSRRSHGRVDQRNVREASQRNQGRGFMY